MYPILETKSFILKPLQEKDYDGMVKIFSNPIITKTMEAEFYDEDNFRKVFLQTVKSGVEDFSIRLKKTDEFIGFIQLHNYINKKKNTVKYSQINTALSPEYWGKGFCTEVTQKILHFAFMGIKTPWTCANQLCINPAAGKVLQKCGFNYYKTFNCEKGPYDQYRYIRDDYIKNNDINFAEEEAVYNYSLPVRKSPYSYESPVRKIKSIKYVKEPTGYLCGQSVIAMLADVSVDEAIDIIGHDRGTSVAEIDEALAYYGIKHAKSRKRFKADTVLPEICILGLQLPGYGHWSLYYKGKYYDPEFGVLKELPPKAKLCYYWEIMN
jgi:RimJ/RimL family protein N-acetyltransferase